jgi:membrane protein DedA with SNARE-associated domain
MPSWNDLMAYLTIFCLLVAAGVGLPIPEEGPVVAAGVLVGKTDHGHPYWFIMLPVCIAGVVISDGLLYSIGRLYGPRLLAYRWVRTRLLPPEKRARIEDNFHRYGVKILLIARVLPGIRAPIFITAGIMRLTFWRFLLADGLYAIPGVSLLFTLAFWFTDQFREVFNRAEKARPLIVVCVLAAVAGVAVYAFLKHPVPTGDPEELKDVPIIGRPVAERLESHSHPPEEKKEGKKTNGAGADKNGAGEG